MFVGRKGLLDPCGNDEPMFPIVENNLTLSGTFVFDTTLETFVGGGEVFDHELMTLNGAEVYVWSVNNFELPSGSRLAVVGDRPLLIRGVGEMIIGGEIDVSSRWVESTTQFGGAFIPGAGAIAETGCTPPAMMVGMLDTDGAGGGAGGGFGEGGAAGGFGRSPAEDNAGGMAGAAIALQGLVGLQGGCPGGVGGEGNQSMPAPPSPGGGGLYLSAVGTVTVNGRLFANGATGVVNSTNNEPAVVVVPAAG